MQIEQEALFNALVHEWLDRVQGGPAAGEKRPLQT
jgi:hypothetical protein